MPEALAVPPPKIAFRIVDNTGQYVLTKGNQGEHYLPVERALADATVPDAREEQLWLLEPFGTDFVLRHKSSGRIMFFGDGGGAPVHLVSYDGKSLSACSFLTLKVGRGEYKGFFRLLNVTGNSSTTLTSGSSGFNLVDSHTELGSEQYWSFDLEPLEVVSIEYDFKESKKLNGKPLTLVNTVLSNDTASDQTLTYEVNEKTSQTLKWETEKGLKIGGSLKVKAAIPKVVAGELGFEISGTWEWVEGQTYTKEQLWKASFPVKARPGEHVRAKSTVRMGTVEVPYTLILKTKTEHRLEQKGIWSGVMAWNLRHELKAETEDGVEGRTILSV